MRIFKLILLSPIKLLNILTSGIPVILYNIILGCGVVLGIVNTYKNNGLIGTIIISFFILIFFAILFGLLNFIIGLIHNVTDVFIPTWEALKSTNDVDYKMNKKYTLKYFYKEQQKEEQNLSCSLT